VTTAHDIEELLRQDEADLKAKRKRPKAFAASLEDARHATQLAVQNSEELVTAGDLTRNALERVFQPTRAERTALMPPRKAPAAEPPKNGQTPLPAAAANGRLNQALHMAVVTRMRDDPETPHLRRTPPHPEQEQREVRRTLKRYLARKLFRALNTSTPLLSRLDTHRSVHLWTARATFLRARPAHRWTARPLVTAQAATARPHNRSPHAQAARAGPREVQLRLAPQQLSNSSRTRSLSNLVATARGRLSNRIRILRMIGQSSSRV